MDVVGLLDEAKAEGISLEVIEGELQIEAPSDKKHWLDRLRPHKLDILHFLQGGQNPNTVQTPLPKLVQAYRHYPVHTLPNPLDTFVTEASQAIGCDPSFIALPLLASLARVLGNSRVIRLKRTWTEPAIIWGAIIGKSGTHKTPAMQIALRFIDRLQAESFAVYSEQLSEYDNAIQQYERDLAHWKRSKNSDPPPWEPEKPVCTRYATSDCTIEALASLLAVQFDGLLVSRDELAGWLNGIAEYKGGKGSDLGHWLACWSAQSMTVDRKTGAIKMVHVPRAAVSLIGGIQPEILRKALGREHLQDGLCARLLLAMPDPKPVVWSDATVNPKIENAVSKVFDRLKTLEPAANEHGEPEPFPIDLTQEARTLWVEYYDRHGADMVDVDEDLSAAWSKLRAYTARLALIFQLCSWAAGEATSDSVDESSMQAAIELSDWFGYEAKRVYGLFIESVEDRDQRELADLIRRKGGSISPRELAHSCRKYRRTGEAETALQALIDGKVGTWETRTSTGPGRPSRRFVLTEGKVTTVTESAETAEIFNTVTVTDGGSQSALRNGDAP